MNSPTDFQHYYAVVMAGGGGTRLWPLSRQRRPKQMLQLIDDNTLFQNAIARLSGLFPADHILIVTVADQAETLRAQAPEIPPQNFLLEPQPRGTASVVGLGAIAVLDRDPQGVMAVLTSDHYIGDQKRYQLYLQVAYQVSLQNYLVTLGISPTFPATGYGYIQQGASLGVFQDIDVYHALKFVEKPDMSKAKEMFKRGDHAWNSGMFIWKASQIMQEFSRQMPELAFILKQIAASWRTPDRDSVLEAVWDKLKVETIDFGIMEGAHQVAVIPATGLNWSDVGSWDSLFEVIESDENGNIILAGDHIGLETQNSLIYTDQGHPLVVTIGIDNLVVVYVGDVLLVCNKDQAQKVRTVVNQLRQSGHESI